MPCYAGKDNDNYRTTNRQLEATSLEIFLSFLLKPSASREKKEKRFLGTPQTPAGRTLHPVGKGYALSLMRMGQAQGTVPMLN
jgi:hypothetical protein